MPSWMSTGGGASTGTAARGGGSNGERVPRTGWRFVRHLNRLSALAFLQPVRKVSLGAEFPTPFRESILRPGLPTPLPRAGRAENTNAPSDAWGSRFVALGKSEVFVLRPRPEARAGPNSSLRFLGSSIWDPQTLSCGCEALGIRTWRRGKMPLASGPRPFALRRRDRLMPRRAARRASDPRRRRRPLPDPRCRGCRPPFRREAWARSARNRSTAGW